MYHCGLRVGEAVRIEVKDIHGRENPPRLHVKKRQGRQGPLCAAGSANGATTAAMVAQAPNPKFLFRHPAADGRPHFYSQPIDCTRAFVHERELRAIGLSDGPCGQRGQCRFHHAHPAHSYATHLLEEGVSLLQISVPWP